MRPRPPSPRAAACCLLLVLPVLAGSALAAPPAAGGVALIEALERAPLTAVGIVGEPRRLDQHGYVAPFRIERVVAQSAAANDVVAGSSIAIAWEELAPSRPARFGLKSRVLVSLDPLPGSSLWRARLPDPASRSRTLAVAMRGNAFLRNPSPASVTLLQRFAVLDAKARNGAAGQHALGALSASAEPALADAAVERLLAIAELAASIDAQSAASLVAALLRSDLPERSTRALLHWIERERPAALGPALTLEASKTPPSVAAVAGLAALQGGLDDEAATRLARSDDPAWRRLAARWASGPGAIELVGRLARRDADASVRRVAVERLSRFEGDAAENALLRALSDEDVGVRGEALRALGRRGPGVIPALREIAMAGRGDAARSALAALDVAQRSGEAALVEIAEQHEDAGMRMLAAMALGRPVGED